MCGRFVQALEPRIYGEYFGVDSIKTEALDPSWNVAPWWAKDRKRAARNINARSETVASKPAFRDSFAKRRCIVPADGFYEWERKPKGKLPHFIYADSGHPLALAGLWASWRDPDTDERITTCTIITGPPNDTVARLHDRMPIILAPEAWEVWLDSENDDQELLQSLLRVHPEKGVAEHAVSTLVNKVANNVPECIAPLETGAVDL
jgi:putative SOS response-associated peptidase YedK